MISNQTARPVFLCCTVARYPAYPWGSYVLNAKPYEVTRSQLAVYSEIEERQVSKATVKLKARSDCPDVLRLKRWLRPNKLSFVPWDLQRSF